MTGCPFNIPKFSPAARKVFKCTLCNDRVSVGLEPACIKACPTGCLHFGTKPEMKELAETRAAQLRRSVRIRRCGSLRSGRRGRNARDLRPARCEESGAVRRPSERSAYSLVGAAVEKATEVAGQSGDRRRHGRHGIALHAIWPEERGADSAGCFAECLAE